MKAYRFLAEADQEFHEQIGYYLGRSISAAENYVGEVEAAVREIREYPEIGGPLSPVVRQRERKLPTP